MPRTVRTGLLIASIGALVAACATPVGVRRVDVRTVYRTLTASVLSRLEPSAASVEMLHRLDHFDQYRTHPARTLAEMHAVLPPEGGRDLLFALAELSLLHAMKSQDHAHSLAAAVYAYAFLFPGTGHELPEPFDPRLRLAAGVYNRAIAASFESEHERGMVLESGDYPLPFGILEVTVDPTGFTWGGYRLVEFASADDLEVRGLRNRYRTPGLGAPLTASLKPAAGEPEFDPEKIRVRPETKVPVSAFLRLHEPRESLAQSRLYAALELYASDTSVFVDVQGERVPLEYEHSVALAYSLEGGSVWEFERRGFLSGELRSEADGLTMHHPYHAGRVPVVLVHGTASSPARWAELVNELSSDPVIQQGCQFWFFSYNTGNPVTFSAGKLREDLRMAVAELDPEGRDPALHRIVMIGHSQGGLLAKLTVIDSGTIFWDRVSPVPLDDLDMKRETREILTRSLFIERVAHVERVVFMATPHRGSFLAGRRLARFASRLVSLPTNLVDGVVDLVERNPDAGFLRSLDGIPTSVDNMAPSNQFLETLATIPIHESVTAHSVIAVQGDGPVEEGNDGVVEFQSARLDGVASEFVVRSGHSVQRHPHAILEVRRILREHLGEPVSAR